MKNIYQKIFLKSSNIALILLSIFFSLIICEVFVRKFFPQPLGGNFRTFSKNQDFFINIPNKETFSRFGKYQTTYTTDENGWRGGVINEKAKFKIAFLGDSYTFGLYLDYEDTYPYKFFLNLNKKNKSLKNNLGIINASIPATGVAEWLAYLQDYGPSFKSEYIILGVNTTSFGRGYKNRLFTIDCSNNSAYRNKIKNPRSKGYDIISSIFRENIFTNNSEIYYLTRLAISRFREKYLNRQKEFVFTYEKLDKENVLCSAKTYLKEIKAISKQLDSKLIVLNLGFQENIKNFFSEPTMNISPDSIVLKELNLLTKELGIEYIDASPYINQALGEKKLIIIPNDGHPTPAGNDQVARALNENLIPILYKNLNYKVDK